MNKKIIFIIGIVTIGIAVGLFGYFGAVSLAKGENSPTAWSGTWQMGPNLDTTILGCAAGNGLARFTGIYYPEQDRVYFLGGRCELDTTTTGAVFYFDPVTETYNATGEVMDTPVSNYQMVRIDNDGRGNGPGFYIVGGRKGDSTQTNAVQVYYPDINLAETIATDPFPPAVSYSPGGVVAQGGEIYVFGGFDGVNMYATTWIYNPLAAAGARWTQSGCDLPTPRSYIGAVALGTKIYAIGGNELPALTPINDTVVYDTANPGSCWQDGLMADLPQANGDAPAVYVGENYIGGGIFVVGGFWPAPGPNRWVFRYDVAGDFWESFPDLAIPAPATGRRNEAAVYIPSSSGGTGVGIPGLWAFGGYDGSGTNAMTESSEFFANPATELLLLPQAFQVAGLPGTTVSDLFTVVNQSAIEDTYDLSFTSDVSWTVSIPSSIGPIPPGLQDAFTMTVDIPADVPCGVTGSFPVTATSQANPVLTASATITVRAICGVGGKVTDVDSGMGIANAYIQITTDPNGAGGNNYDGYTDAEGNYLIKDVLPGFYYSYANALQHQPSFYPEVWPSGAITFTLGTEPILVNFSLVASNVSWTPDEVTVSLVPGGTTAETLTITNNGTGPYYFNISLLDSSQPQPPQMGALAIPGLPRVDEQIFSDIAASTDGVTDFVAVLGSQADLTAAYGISDWNERGWAVYNILTQFADATQVSLRAYLNHQGVDYTPLYIINAVIVHSGSTTLVNNLAARQDVAQLVANRKIAVEDLSPSYMDTLLQPVNAQNAVEWNISKIKADQVWADYGVKGEGMVVAEIDTGTQFDHPALVNQYRGNLGGGTFDHNYNWYDPYAQCPDGGKTPCDPGAHGTHVMGTMVGDDGGANQIGVAPGAKWISCKGGDAASGYLLTNQLLTCAQWILAPYDLNGQNPDPSMRPNVVNNSWGGGPNDYWYTGAVAAWRAAGIFPAFANGNAGPSCSTAHSPGDYWHSFASGASDMNDMVASFSSRGPAVDTNFLKPQITAPGVNIRSSVPGSGYASKDGTSMASPHSAGAVALLLSADPELVGQVDLISWVLEQSASPLTDPGSNCGGDYVDGPNNDWGYGLLDVHAAVALAKAGNLIPSWVTLDQYSGLINGGGHTHITLTFTAPVEQGTVTATLMLIGDDPYNPDVRIPLTMKVAEAKIFMPIIRR
jgi:subtilisin family serine protease